MAQKIENITYTFNAAVKKGGLFQIDLREGGIMAESWEVKVASGKATLVNDSHANASFGYNTKTFKADEAGADGKITLVATSISRLTKKSLGEKKTFTVTVL